MISVQNHLPPLSGNKWLLFLGVALLAGACSPKLQPVSAPVKTETEKPVVKQEQAKQAVKAPSPKVATVSLILPFSLDHLNPGSSYTDISLKQANLSADYYQGFKLALDSLTSQGYNYELHVFDSQGSAAQAHSLAYNSQIRVSDLIVGPVFPDDLKAFTGVLSSARRPILSPLSPASPATIKNQNLVTAVPPLEYHAWAAAKYIKERIKPKKVFILKSGYSEDNEYISFFKKGIDSLSKKQVQIVPLTVVRGNLTSLAQQLSLTNQNVFIVPSTNQSFLMITLRSLDSIAKKYPVTVFGHPNWEKYSFLNAELLQRLKTHITTADKVDYKATATLTFLRSYRKAYHTEPTDFAIKGFDEGLYFGRLLGIDQDNVKTQLEKNDFTGLHNEFHFVKKPGLGWVNTHVNVLKYSNFELKRAE
jgi:ABC-type branched-subunit amino acid transport system substrate-binding protein